MKTILAAIIGAVLIATTSAQQQTEPKKDIKNFMYADGNCYYLEAGKDNLPTYQEGYWGHVNASFDSGSVRFKLNGIDREVLLSSPAANKQARQCILLKKINGILKAVPLSPSTEEQLTKALAEKKVFCYGKAKDAQDGVITCEKCGGQGKTKYTDSGYLKTVTYNKCIECSGAGKKANIIKLPEIKVME